MVGKVTKDHPERSPLLPLRNEPDFFVCDVFDAARTIGWDRLPDGRRAELVHVPFGSVLGPDRKPLKTRSGENVTLSVLLQEAIDRGTHEVRQRAADPGAPTHALPDEELATIGRAVGIGAVKYADLSSDLVRDYVFDMDRMIAFEGHTGPYLQYAHARVCSIFARAGIDPSDVAGAPLTIAEPAEKLDRPRLDGVIRGQLKCVNSSAYETHSPSRNAAPSSPLDASVRHRSELGRRRARLLLIVRQRG